MVCKLFTRELGFIAAFAQGARLAKSKLAAHVQPGSFVNVSLVRGKEVWRLVGAIEYTVGSASSRQGSNVFDMDYASRAAYRTYWARISKFLSRFLHGEDPHADIFDDIELVATIVYSNVNNTEVMRATEYLFVLRSLFRFGYIAPGNLAVFIQGELTIELVERFTPHQKPALALINKALKESHL